MVYCGKPSRGCQMCRTRRIKCDETKPTCNQCAKSRRQCPGYKDDFDLVFRNETQATERRARRAVNSKKTSAQTTFAQQQSAFATGSQYNGSNESQALVLSNSEAASLFGPSETISTPIEQQAPCFFVTNYVFTPHKTSKGHFDFLEPMLEKESPDSHLSLAFAAVSMASLANRPNSRGRVLQSQALASYTKALRAVNLALQNPALQKTDQTLASILLLGFFETIASERTNASAWYSHVDGAVQLVKMRGKKQLRTKVGNSLFQYVRGQLSVTCMTASKTPPMGVEWWISENRDDPASFISRMCLQISELRCEINVALSSYPRTPEYFQRIQHLIRRMQAMEQEYIEWDAQVPDSWRPETVAWVDQVPGGDITKAEVCPGKVDVYSDLWTAQLWNSARVARMFVSGGIVRCAAWLCSPVDYRTTPEYAHAVRLCGDIVTDTIASIPYILGWDIDRQQSWGFSTPPRAIGGFFAIWPLFCLTNTDFISDSQRAWAKGRMMYVSETLGLNHAKVLSRFSLRLPSMIIRRDSIVHTPPPTQMTAVTMSRGYSPPVVAQTPNYLTASTTYQIPIALAPQMQPQPQSQPQYSQYKQYQPSPSLGPDSTTSPPTSDKAGVPIYTMNPLQQREAMQRENWENERKKLLKKASNAQGDSVERLLANYLQV